MISIYTQIEQGEAWLRQYSDRLPLFTCILGFTETGLIPGISAAGSTPEDRKYTACADAEFLYYGAAHQPQYPLPPLTAGASPVVISRAVVEELNIPVDVFNAGLPQSPAIPVIDLGGSPARCLSTGAAMELTTVHHLFEQGLLWGDRLAAKVPQGYIILSECVVGGTTTAQAILTGLGIDAAGKVNSSHPVCNHEQKWQVVQQGLEKMRRQWFDSFRLLCETLRERSRQDAHQPQAEGRKQEAEEAREQGEEGGKGEDFSPLHPAPCPPACFSSSSPQSPIDPLKLVAAVGDPMQVVVAGMAIAASRSCGVMLAGGTQMLAVYALTSAIAQAYDLVWQPTAVVVGTTRWVAEDPTGSTVELALNIGKNSRYPQMKTPPLLATQLSFANSRYPQLQAYEQGFVKEGVGAGAACIAANLYKSWQQHQLLQAIESQIQRLELGSGTR